MSPMHFSYGRGERRSGFTILELLIVIAIISIITTIVLVKYVSFDSTVLLKGEAYEIALALREAQVKSVSSYRNEAVDLNDAFNYPYGVSLSMAETDNHSYVSFVYKNAEIGIIPKKNDDDAEEINRYTMSESMKVADLCYVLVGSPDTCTSTEVLDISYRRPDFKALFHASDYTGNGIIEMVRIKLSATRPGAGSGVFVVEVSRLGQISLYRE